MSPLNILIEIQTSPSNFARRAESLFRAAKNVKVEQFKLIKEINVKTLVERNRVYNLSQITVA